MKTLKLTISFDGTAYHGWQTQKNARTVQDVLHESLRAIFGEVPLPCGCSRTDAGVHARRFVCAVQTSSALPCVRVPYALNYYLPKDIAVRSCRELSADFHPRYDTLWKEYRYRIHNSPLRDPLLGGKCLQVPRRLDESALDLQAKKFVGTHDFAAYAASGGGTYVSTIRQICSAGVTREGESVWFWVRGTGFLYKMVRIMVGTLLDISDGKLPKDAIERSFAQPQRDGAGFTAPPQGLFLWDIAYKDEDTSQEFTDE
jgi:tRNA pseudouridine38-40 synthase